MTDLTAITTPFGLLDAETQAALRSHGGPYEWYASADGWIEWSPNWDSPNTYRVKPAPPKPRDAWATWHTKSKTWRGIYSCEASAQRGAQPGDEIIHVIEKLP